MTFDLGFSSPYELIGGSLGNIDKVIYKSKKIILNIFYELEDRPEIKRVDLLISPKNYKKILKDREISMDNGIGLDFRKVKAKIVFEGDTMKSEIRLKGDFTHHWRSIKRMSFRVSLKGKNSIFGYKVFSIHKPDARQHPYDQTFQDMQNQLGNISSQHSYVRLHVNGISWGIMHLEEHMSKEFLEKQSFKESLIIKFGNEDIWAYNKMAKNKYNGYKLSDPSLNVKLFGANKYLKQDIYRKWYSYISKEHIKESNELYDNKSFTKSLLLALTWNSTHTLYPSNSRYYFNPYSLKLQPITTDQGKFSSINKNKIIPIPLIYQKIINYPEFSKNLKSNYKEVIGVVLNSQETMSKWQSFFPLDEKINTDILIENNSKLINNLNQYINLDKHICYDSNCWACYTINNIYKPITKDQSSELRDHIYARHFENGDIHVYNLLKDKVEITNITIDGDPLIGFNKSTINGYENELNPDIISTSLKGVFDSRIVIETKSTEFSRKYKIDFTHLINDIHNPFLNNFDLSLFKYLKKLDNETYGFKKGNWNITTPLIIDGNLIIEEGTILNFSQNSYLIVKGSIKMNGTIDKKIILKAINETWKGMYIYDAEDRSLLNNVIIQNTSFLKDGILNLTGGVNFYKSDVDILNTNFSESIAEDALNIVCSDFFLDKVIIDVTNSDAFDSDFSIGTITNSIFKNIGGDGIDFSGSSVSVSECQFSNIKDKAVSVGEESNIILKNLIIDNIGVGIASKDGSVVSAQGLNISNYSLNALMTYKKKSFYNNPELYAKNISFDSKQNAYLSQVGTTMTIDGENIFQKDVDVDEMYLRGVMSNKNH